MSLDKTNHRAIIHVDMDAFYASVEQRDFPQYRGKPLIVGGDPLRRGVVATCSYEARKFGIHSAMASATALRKCPQAIFLRPRFEAYRQVSSDIRRIFSRFSDRIEPLSLDEAYLDVTEHARAPNSSVLIAKDIRAQIKQETRLIASAGVSYNKFLAKIASDRCKPDGLLYISPEQGPAFVQGLKIRDFYGVGKATEQTMHGLGIETGADLLRWHLAELQALFGSSAEYYYQVARGIDERPVTHNRIRKSVSTEDTFDQDLSEQEAMLSILREQAEQLQGQLAKLQVKGKTLTIKVKFSDFSQVTRSLSKTQSFHSAESIIVELPALLESALIKPLAVRLLGVGVSSLIALDEVENNNQIDLFQE